MVDAAGAIYVLGGGGFGGTLFHDVWVSTDGGARAGLRREGYSRGYLGGTKGVLRGSIGVV